MSKIELSPYSLQQLYPQALFRVLPAFTLLQRSEASPPARLGVAMHELEAEEPELQKLLNGILGPKALDIPPEARQLIILHRTVSLEELFELQLPAVLLFGEQLCLSPEPWVEQENSRLLIVPYLSRIQKSKRLKVESWERMQPLKQFLTQQTSA